MSTRHRIAIAFAAGVVAFTAAVAPTPAVAKASKAAYTPVNDLLWSDPVKARTRISDQLVRLIDSTPAGESIDVVTYFIGSDRIRDALLRAFARGVNVRVIADSKKRKEFPQIVDLRKAFNVSKTDQSWVLLPRDSVRAKDGSVHQKTYRFSRVGDARWVTVNGSYNSADLSESRAYALMYQIVSKPIYDEFATVFAVQARDVDTTSTQRETYKGNWEATFSPLNAKKASTDPVMKRLKKIPANKNTVIRINMFSMWDDRGTWIAKRLAEMAKKGAQIEFLAGPTAVPPVQTILRRGGVKVYSGCFKDGTFTHSKDMSATYVKNGKRVYWTWVGSDNWTGGGQFSDEAVVGLKDKAMYDKFQSHWSRIRGRAGAVPTSKCKPLV